MFVLLDILYHCISGGYASKTHFGKLLERYIPIYIGVPTHGMSMCISGSTTKKKNKKWKERLRNRGGRWKREEEEEERKSKKRRKQATAAYLGSSGSDGDDCEAAPSYAMTK